MELFDFKGLKSVMTWKIINSVEEPNINTLKLGLIFSESAFDYNRGFGKVIQSMFSSLSRD